MNLDAGKGEVCPNIEKLPHLFRRIGLKKAGMPSPVPHPHPEYKVSKYQSGFLGRTKNISLIPRKKYVNCSKWVMRNLQGINDGMKWLRIKEHPFDVSEGNLVVDDKLETEGTLKLYENVGGSIYLFLEPSVMDNLALVAEAVVEEMGEKKLWMKRISYEYGYDELCNPLMEQIQHFADFYGYALGALDLRKKR